MGLVISDKSLPRICGHPNGRRNTGKASQLKSVCFFSPWLLVLVRFRLLGLDENR